MERPDDNPRGKTNISQMFQTFPVCSAQARQIKQCMNTHTECISYEILRREAGTSMEHEEIYQKKEDETVKGEKKAHKRERLIINPEFVASLDQGDGAQEFDDDYYNNQV